MWNSHSTRDALWSSEMCNASQSPRPGLWLSYAPQSATVGLRFGVRIGAYLKPPGKFALRPIASVLFCFATIVASALAQDEAQSIFAISIAPSQDATQPGTPVWNVGAHVFVIVTMTNNSNRTLHLSLIDPVFDYRMTVRDDATGQPVSETEQYRKMKASQKSHFHTTGLILVTLKPHASLADAIDVSQLYDLSRPGEYSIQIERDKPTELGTGGVQSNVINATIKP